MPDWRDRVVADCATTQWQREQGACCGCRGTDEWCGCQNEQPSDRTKFNGTAEQLMNALREAERRGGMMGAICGAAADEIQKLKKSTYPPEAALPSLIKPEDLKIEAWPPRKPPGGQHVGTGPSGVKVTHLPSGIEACVEIGRSQHVNRLIAVEMIEAAITHPRFRQS